MESSARPDDTAAKDTLTPAGSASFVVNKELKRFLAGLTSLKLTVTLLAAAIFIVFAGTMAQAEKSIWQVTDEYFRVAVAWIDLRIFFPPHWFPNMPQLPGMFPFPGGWLIGFVMALNLVAAHFYRFKLQARGNQLAWGGIVSVLGLLLIWLAIVSGSNRGDSGDLTEIQWSTARLLVKWLLGGLFVVSSYAIVRRSTQRTTGWWISLAGVAGLGAWFAWASSGNNIENLNDSSLRILWQLLKSGLASLVLLGGCALLFNKRAGIVLIHAGIGLLMFGELYVGVRAVEGHMRIEEGQTSNFVEEDRYLELAFVDASDPQIEDVVVVPQSKLKVGEKISHKELPFDIMVINYFANSEIQAAHPGVVNSATAGLGLEWIARPIPTVTGMGDEINLPSAYVTLSPKDNSKPLGTYLVSLLHSYQGMTEKVTIDGKNHNVNLRYRRAYKPYSIRLIDFRSDTYLGTSTTKNFSSDIQLVDETRNVDREVKIWMNNPLRFAGETFYQSGHTTNSETGAEITILQVVSNAGWMIPYVSCMMVAIGMLAHFWIVLLRFLRRRSAKPVAQINERSTGTRVQSKTNIWMNLCPLLIVAGCIALLANAARPPSAPDGEMNLSELGKLPVVYEGRVKPLDTLARNSLSVISSKQTYKDSFGKTQPAIRWLLDVITGSASSSEYRVFRIESLDVLQTLNLQRRKGFRYAIHEFQPNLKEFYRQVKLASTQAKRDLSIHQKKILELDHKMRLYRLLEESFRRAEVRPGHDHADLFAALKRADELAIYQPPLAVPSEDPASVEWQTFASAWTVSQSKQVMGEKGNSAAESLTTILTAYGSKDHQLFNDEVAKYLQALEVEAPDAYDSVKTQFEAAFNHWQPFFWCAFLYVFAFVLVALSWLGWSVPLNRAAFGVVLLTFAVHSVAIVARIYISGRPPVTNLYSSAVFIGWASVVLGIVLELVYRIGIGNILASAAGFATLLIAHFLSRSGDTFVVLQAVLDTQFWLATHVVCITLGYSTTFVAGGLGCLYIVRGFCTPSLTPHVGKELCRMIYGTICFAIFFSFVGTVLGGLWADDSWGRFWGWDPKENGALMIVLWNALVLHARWAGLAKQRGLAVLAVGGNICTAWSWFGTNELGVGLHSYGFTEGVLVALGIFCLSQLTVIAIGLLPKDYWWSHRAISSA